MNGFLEHRNVRRSSRLSESFTRTSLMVMFPTWTWFTKGFIARQRTAALIRLYVLLCGPTHRAWSHAVQFTDATCGTVRLKPMKLAGLAKVSARRTILVRLGLPLCQRTAAGRRPTGSRSFGLTRRRCANQGTSLRPSGDPVHPPSRMHKTRNDPNRLYHSTNPPFPGKGKTCFAVWERRARRPATI